MMTLIFVQNSTTLFESKLAVLPLQQGHPNPTSLKSPEISFHSGKFSFIDPKLLHSASISHC